MPTIQDVAKQAGVAPMTVSRVVNKSGYVAEAMRARVETAIADLGYVPNTLARSLRSRRTNTLALVVTDVTNPFFTTVARGVEDAASDAGFMVILSNTDEHEAKERRSLQMLLQKQVDGILLVPAGDATESLRVIQHQQTPVVVLDRRVSGANVDVVRCDSEQGAYQLGRLLVSLGHRTVATVAGPQGLLTSDDRVAGFQRALAEAGLERSARVYHGDIAPVYYGNLTQKSGYDMTLRALSDAPSPTALFATNNFLAIGALNALHDAGRRVPEDVALVAFDDLPPAFVTFPFLTVVDQPAYEMGRKAVEILLTRLDAKDPPPFHEVLLDGELIVRRSSGEWRGPAESRENKL